MMDKLTNLDYWIKAQGKLDITLNENNIIENWINENLNEADIKTSFEIGCYPGKFLTILGKKGIEVNGIDYIPTVVDLKEAFQEKGYNVGEFVNADFTEYKYDKKYDCVMSFGFVEHFANWEEIIVKHLSLVSEKGYVVIEAPNFSGILQRIPRYIFDYKNYKRHNISSMNLKKWNEIVTNNGFEIVSSEYFGGYELWFENRTKNNKIIKLRNMFVKGLQKIKMVLYPNTPEHKNFSCVMGIIAKRKKPLK